MTRDEKLEQISKYANVVSMKGRYTTRTFLNGWIIAKPHIRISKGGKGNEVASIVIYQIEADESGLVKYESYFCLCYAKAVIEKIKTIDTVCLVSVDAELYYNKNNKSYYPHIVQLDIDSTLETELVE